MRLLSDQDNNCRRPRDLHPKQTAYRFVFDLASLQSPLVRRLRADRAVSDVVTLPPQEVRQFVDLGVVGMVMADEYVASFRVSVHTVARTAKRNNDTATLAGRDV
jgi:hypothetical protein